MAKTEIDKILTPKFRVSFPEVFEAKSFQGGKPKFSIVMLFPADTNLQPMKDLAKRAIAKKWGDKSPAELKTPFKNGNDKDYDGYQGTIFAGANSLYPPGVVENDANRTPITVRSEFYAGCYAIASVNAFCYDTAGNKGVSFGLQNIIKINDGEPLSGGESAEAAFESIPLPDEGAMGVEGGGESILDL